MNTQRVLENREITAEEREKYAVRSRTPRVTDRSKSVVLGVEETVVLDVPESEIQDAAATWCWWRVDWLKREKLPAARVTAIKQAGRLHVHMSDLVERAEREAAQALEDMSVDQLGLMLEKIQKVLAAKAAK